MARAHEKRCQRVGAQARQVVRLTCLLQRFLPVRDPGQLYKTTMAQLLDHVRTVHLWYCVQSVELLPRTAFLVSDSAGA